MYVNSLLLNALGTVDKTFFLICLGIIVVIVAVYFLIPVFNKSQYEERRNNLRKREAAFKNSDADTHKQGAATISDGDTSWDSCAVNNTGTDADAQKSAGFGVEKVTEE